MKSLVPFVVALALACASVASPVRAADPYVVSVVLSLTGSAGVLGTKEAASLRALETMVNAQGGVRGRPVQFDIADDGSNPETAAQLVTALAAKNAPFVIGPSITAACRAVAAAGGTNEPPTFCLSPAIAPPTGGNTFVSAPSIDDVVPTLLRYLQGRQLLKVAVITSTDASGTDFDRRIDGALAQPEFKAVTLVAREHFAPADASVATQMGRIKAAAPDVLLTFAVGAPFGTVLTGVRDAGLDVPVFGSGGNFTYAQMQAYASFLPRELILNGVRGIALDPTATGAVQHAQTAYASALANAGVRSEYATAIAWDPTMIMLEAVKRAGTAADAAKIATALAGLKGWPGIEGTYDFTTHDQRGLGSAAVGLFRYDQNSNAFMQVYPAKRVAEKA